MTNILGVCAKDTKQYEQFLEVYGLEDNKTAFYLDRVSKLLGQRNVSLVFLPDHQIPEDRIVELVKLSMLTQIPMENLTKPEETLKAWEFRHIIERNDEDNYNRRLLLASGDFEKLKLEIEKSLKEDDRIEKNDKVVWKGHTGYINGSPYYNRELHHISAEQVEVKIR